MSYTKHIYVLPLCPEAYNQSICRLVFSTVGRTNDEIDLRAKVEHEILVTHEVVHLEFLNNAHLGNVLRHIQSLLSTTWKQIISDEHSRLGLCFLY